MSSKPVEQLETYGPDRCDKLSLDEAHTFCRRLTLGRYENFSVLSRLVPADRRNDFAAVYAFCRWADDIGDEVGDRERSLELLAWWRRELQECFAGAPRHPVFVALAPVVAQRDLPIEPFDDLIRAFEQDRDEIRDVGRPHRLLPAQREPVGRLVLMVLGEAREALAFARSDDICTALQLTNHWQDIGSDLVDRDRIYVPREFIKIDDFEDRLRRSAKQGHAVDHTFLGESRQLVKVLVEKTWPLFESGEALHGMVQPSARPLTWLLAAGGQRVLRLIEMWNYETVLHRPTLGRPTKLMLVTRAIVRAKLGISPPGAGGTPAAAPEAGARA